MGKWDDLRILGKCYAFGIPEVFERYGLSDWIKRIETGEIKLDAKGEKIFKELKLFMDTWLEQQSETKSHYKDLQDSLGNFNDKRLEIEMYRRAKYKWMFLNENEDFQNAFKKDYAEYAKEFGLSTYIPFFKSQFGLNLNA